jgi:uncharacterized protein YggT (Ycf19 family)
MVGILVSILDIYSIVIIVSALISWFPVSQDNPVVQLLNALTAPVYAPIRAIIDPSKTGGIDISSIIVLVLISFLKRALVGY